MAKRSKKEDDPQIVFNNKQVAESLYSKKILLRCKNEKQKKFINLIDQNEITICFGPAGCGKSYLSIYKALQLLSDPDNNYQKIYIVTPTVEVGNSLGYLKGTLEEKIFNYIYSTYYLIDRMIGKENRERLVATDIIHAIPLQFLRGINIDNAILVGEELQNSTIQQFKTLITRIGFASKYILSGDIEQVDIKDKINGLQDAINRFSDIKEIGFIKFENQDIVRNPLISKILSKY
jgi:phosphate starvation-inducible PhoH-like protein